MLALKAIAASGRTVIGTSSTDFNLFIRIQTRLIASIHQPRSDIWRDGIDNIVLLAKGGLTAFSCPKDQIGPMCTTLGYPLPEMVNPADWLLDLISVDSRGTREAATRTRVSSIVDFWSTQEDRIMRERASTDLDHMPTEVVTSDGGQASLLVALPVIIERMIKNLWRQQAGEAGLVRSCEIYVDRNQSSGFDCISSLY